jgi:hypothetical protein
MKIKLRTALLIRLSLFILYFVVTVVLYIIAPRQWAWILFLVLSAAQLVFAGMILSFPGHRTDSEPLGGKARRTISTSIHGVGFIIFLGLSVYLLAVNNLAWIVGAAAAALQVIAVVWHRRRDYG